MTTTVAGRPRVRARARAALGIALAAMLLLLAGCGGKGKAQGAAPASTSPAAPAFFPLTGLPAGDAATRARPALSIKIDNIDVARPQAGLNQADVVVEEPVEGGLTRLFATWQSKDAAEVGPVRSARPVDALLLRQLGPSLFAFAGASAGVFKVIRNASGATLLDSSSAPDAYRRVSGRNAPHNTFTSTAALYDAGRRVNPKLGPPRNLLTFAARQSPAAKPVRTARLQFSTAARSSWQWTGKSFIRSQDGTADKLVDGSTVSSDNVVVMSVAVRPSGNVDVLGNPTPDPDLIGSGRAWVLRDGTMVTATWRRAAAGSQTQLLGADGQPIPLHPGRTWIELLPAPQQPSFTS